MLIIFGGLPGVGKSAIARELARQVSAAYLRVDTIEQAIRDSDCCSQALNDAGYRVAYVVAAENLRMGNTVIADSVNPLAITRDAWLAVATEVGVPALEVEVTCSDAIEHRRRLESRISDVPGLHLPTWEEVLSREYHEWNGEHLVIDTAARSVEECAGMIRGRMPRQP